MTLRILFLTVLLMAQPAQAQVPTPAAEEALRTFYSWVLAHPSRALPSPSERTALGKVLTPRLLQLLKDASATESRCVKAAPKGEKPDIVEGDLFVGNYEGATEVAYGNQRQDGESLTVDMDLVYVDPRFPKAHKHRVVAWKDQLRLRRFDGHWLVNDVQFPQGRSLVAGLNEYIAEGARTCAAR